MGTQFRKSKSIGKHSRVTVGKKTVGASTGVKGIRASVNSKGQIRTTLSLPGTGLRKTTTVNVGKASKGFTKGIGKLTGKALKSFTKMFMTFLILIWNGMVWMFFFMYKVMAWLFKGIAWMFKALWKSTSWFFKAVWNWMLSIVKIMWEGSLKFIKALYKTISVGVSKIVKSIKKK